MKIYIYDHLDASGKPKFQAIELDEASAEEWVQIEFERTGEMRTAQEIQDDIDREFINSDRREYSHRERHQLIRNEDGMETDIIDTIADKSLSPEEMIEESEADDLIANLMERLNPAYADVLLKIVIGGQPISDYAKENGLSTKSVYNRLCYAKEAVRKKYSGIFKKGK